MTETKNTMKSPASLTDFEGIKPLIIEVPAPEIAKGKIVRVRCPDVRQLEELNAAYPQIFVDGGVKRKPGYLADWAIGCVVDKDDKRMFTLKDRERIALMPGALLQRIFYAAMNAESITEEDVSAETKK